MAEDFPEDKYDYKPTPAQRSFAEQLLHAAGANYYFTNPVMGQKPPAEEDAEAGAVQNQSRCRHIREESHLPTAPQPSSRKARKA